MSTTSPLPNIVLVLSDDHSVPHLGCYGEKTIKTPHLDRFASDGMRFDRAFTSSPQCVPSRVSIMSGMSAVAARVGRFSSPLPPDVRAVPDLLREAGYYTGLCRRNFHLDGPGRAAQFMEDLLDKHGMKTFPDRVDFLDFNSPASETANKVNEFLDGRPDDQPFFLWVNFNDPHHPWDEDAIPEPHDPADIELPCYLPDLPGVREDMARYYDEVSRLDGEFQTILDVLDARGEADNTLVVFMGDNGYAFPHGKGSLYEPGLHVPLLMRWPSVIEPGSATNELVGGEDLPPTFLEAAGLTAPTEMTGVSFLKELRGDPFEGREYIFGERIPHANNVYTPQTEASLFDLSRSVRSDRFKLIYNCTPKQRYGPVDSARDPGWQQMVAAHEAGTLAEEFDRAYFTLPRPVFELFDLQSDPGELNNLAGNPEHADTEQKLKEVLFERMLINYDHLPLPLDCR